jgi:hypothetical protein
MTCLENDMTSIASVSSIGAGIVTVDQVKEADTPIPSIPSSEANSLPVHEGGVTYDG